MRCRPICAIPHSVEAAARDADAVINLVGILFERGRQRFDAVQAFGAEAVALAAAAYGARLVHVSAIGAAENAPSRYARSKAMGEKLVLAAVPSAVILRPSVVFGPEDDFFNKFASIARFAPALPLIGGGHTRFQPVFAGDVASAVAAAIEGRAKAGQIYELGGPQVKSFKELMQFVLATIGRRRLLVPIPFCARQAAGERPAAHAQAAAHARPGRAAAQRHRRVGRGQARRAARSRRSASTPIAMATIVPSYLWRFRKTGQFKAPGLQRLTRAGAAPADAHRSPTSRICGRSHAAGFRARSSTTWSAAPTTSCTLAPTATISTPSACASGC